MRGKAGLVLGVAFAGLLLVIAPAMGQGNQEWHTLRLHLFSNGAALNIPGLQRNQLEEALLSAERSRLVWRHALEEQFKVVFQYLEEAINVAYVNGREYRFSPFPENTRFVELSVAVRHGRGDLMIPRKSIGPLTSATILSPWNRINGKDPAALAYPKSGALWTCAPITAGNCAGPVSVNGRGELARLSENGPASDYYFVLK